MLTKFTQIIPASGELVAGNDNNSLVFLSATAAVNLRIENAGTGERFDDVTGGIYIRRIKPWSQCRFLGAAGTSVEYFVGTEFNDKDETDIRLAVTAIAGSVSVIDAPTTVISDTAPVIVPDSTQTPIVPVSLTRRMVRITVDTATAGVVYLRSTAGVNNLAEIQPGIMYPFPTRAGIDCYHETGADVTVYVFEES
jgi:hypothetical protein